MNKSSFLLIALAVIVAGLGSSPTKANEYSVVCRHVQRALAPATSPDHRQYAPSRLVDFTHLKLEFTPSFAEKTVTGTTTLEFKPISTPVSLLTLDAVDLTIQNIESEHPIHDWHLGDDRLVIHFETPIPVDKGASISITHEAQPRKGLYFRTPDMGYLPGETHLFTQGEAIESRHWFPCFDSPNEKLTSEIICHVPDGMIVLSNGRKLVEERNEETGLVTFHWLQDKPHVNYLIAVVAGYFEAIRDQHNNTPLAFYTLPSQIHLAENSFQGTKDMMRFMEEETGVPYPWDRYDQICVNDFVAGGMENTTLTILTDGTLFDPAVEKLRSSQNLVAHELAHQWFGDLVTCKDWSHIWLNEGFASYFEVLYHEHRDGKNAFHYALLQKLGGWLQNPNDSTGIVTREYDSPMQQFSFRAYPKGAWVLHMIRSQIGADAFRHFMKAYLERYRYQSVSTADLNRVLEELTGRSFDQFLDQWVYHGGHPDLEVTYEWDPATKMAKCRISQKQEPNDDVLLFRFPLTLRFKGDNWRSDAQIEVKSVTEDFYFPLPGQPQIMRVDPEFTLLARYDIKIPSAMLLTQAADESDMIGRILAVRQLGKKASRKHITALQERLEKDAFYGVRIEAARALQSLHNKDALAVLAANVQQPDARVRRQVVTSIGQFFAPETLPATIEMIEREKNPMIRASAIRSLSPYPHERRKEIILQSLRTRSPRETLAAASIRVIRDLVNADYVAPLLAYLMNEPNKIPAGVFAAGLDALARSGHELSDKTIVREFLVSQTIHPRQRLRRAAIQALGTLGDVHAIPQLERLAGGHDDHPDRGPAQSALTKLRQRETPNRQLKGLQEAIDTLKKNELDLKEQLASLKKQFEAFAQAQKETSDAKTVTEDESIPPTQ